VVNVDTAGHSLRMLAQVLAVRVHGVGRGPIGLYLTGCSLVPAAQLPVERATQPVGAAASGLGIKLGGVVLAMNAVTASCMNFHRSTPWRKQVS